MSNPDNIRAKANLLPALMALVVLCLAGAAALTLMSHNAAPLAAAPEQLSLVVQRMPFEAQNALRGNRAPSTRWPRARLSSIR